jgi:hypothetical protein
MFGEWEQGRGTEPGKIHKKQTWKNRGAVCGRVKHFGRDIEGFETSIHLPHHPSIVKRYQPWAADSTEAMHPDPSLNLESRKFEKSSLAYILRG